MATFDVYLDDPRIITRSWLGLTDMRDGDCFWFDLAAVAVDAVVPANSRLQAVEA